MTKQSIHIRVDYDVYLFLKSQQLNISSLANELLNSYVENEQLEIPEEVEVLRQLEEYKTQFNESKEKISLLSVMLAKIREEQKTQDKEEEQLRNDQHELARQMFTARAKGDL